MKIQNVVTIEKNVVDKVFQSGDILIYECELHCDERIIYFVRNDTVIFKQKIKADCGQNQGYISSVDFEGVK